MEKLNKVEVECMTDEEVMKYLIEVSNGDLHAIMG
jgi:predicted RNA-binding protein YlqC (UPF0109 family)